MQCKLLTADHLEDEGLPEFLGGLFDNHICIIFNE